MIPNLIWWLIYSIHHDSNYFSIFHLSVYLSYYQDHTLLIMSNKSVHTTGQIPFPCSLVALNNINPKVFYTHLEYLTIKKMNFIYLGIIYSIKFYILSKILHTFLRFILHCLIFPHAILNVLCVIVFLVVASVKCKWLCIIIL